MPHAKQPMPHAKQPMPHAKHPMLLAASCHRRASEAAAKLAAAGARLRQMPRSNASAMMRSTSPLGSQSGSYSLLGGHLLPRGWRICAKGCACVVVQLPSCLHGNLQPCMGTLMGSSGVCSAWCGMRKNESNRSLLNPTARFSTLNDPKTILTFSQLLTRKSNT